MKKFYMPLAAALMASPGIMAQEEFPDAIYVVGTNNDYTLPGEDANPTVLKDEDGTGIYTGKITNALRILSFNLYTNGEVTVWDSPYAWGAPEAKDYTLEKDVPLEVGMVQGYSKSYFYNIVNWAENGEGTVTVDWNNKTMTIVSNLEAGENNEPENPDQPGTDDPGDLKPNALYMIGGPAGDEMDYGIYKLLPSDDDDYVYEGIFYIGPEEFNFHFYNRIGIQIGAEQNAGKNREIDFDRNDEYRGGLYFPGEGNWTYTGWEGGYIAIYIDMDSEFILITNLPDYVPENPDDNPDNPDDNPDNPDNPDDNPDNPDDNPDNPDDNPDNPDDSGVKVINTNIPRIKFINNTIETPFDTEITIADVSGKTVLRQFGNSVNVANLQKGIYFVNGKGLQSITIVK